MRTHVVRGKLAPETKQQAEMILSELGLSVSDAINLMMKQVIMQRRLPFDITLPKIPNEDTAKELLATEIKEGLIECKDADDLFDQLGI